MIVRAGAFDVQWYRAQRGAPGQLRAGSVATALAAAHYVWRGRAAGLSPHPFFEAEWAFPRGDDEPGTDPLDRLLRSRPRRSASSHPLCDPARWLAAHPAAGTHRWGWFGHFVATARADTPLPLPDWAQPPGGAAGPTYAAARAALLAAAEAGPGGGSAAPAPPEPAEPPDRVEGLVSALLVTGPRWAGAWATVRSVLDGAGAGPPVVQVVLVVGGQVPRAGRVLLGCLPLLDRRVLVLPAAAGQPAGEGIRRALQASSGATVALLQEGVRLWPGWTALAAELGAATALAAPPVLGADGTLRSAGGRFTGVHALPAELLSGLPVDDARRSGELLRVAVPPREVAVLRAERLLAVDGLDPAYRTGWALADLAMRLAGPDPAAGVSVLTSTLAWRPDGAAAEAAAGEAADRRLFAQRWAERAATVRPPDRADAVWQAAGLRVTGWQPPAAAPARAVPAVPAPLLARTDRPAVRLPGGRSVPRLRWALKISAPTGPEALRWGDLHFARALAAALERLGQDAAVDHRDALLRPTGRLDDVVLTIRGLSPVPPRPDAPDQLRLLWVISHPEAVGEEEAAGYDRVFAASLTWGRDGVGPQLRDASGGAVEPLLQATDPARFRPGAGPPDVGDAVLFVGNSRGVYRPVVRTLLEAGVDVGVYGGRWTEFLGAGVVRAEHVPNEQVPALYRGAGIVLNDHWEQMRAQGFVSNRLFDATACAARVVSDEVAGVEELFGGLARTFRTDAELLELVRAGAAAFPPEQRRVELAGEVARRHSFAARAARLLEAAVELRARR